MTAAAAYSLYTEKIVRGCVRVCVNTVFSAAHNRRWLRPTLPDA